MERGPSAALPNPHFPTATQHPPTPGICTVDSPGKSINLATSTSGSSEVTPLKSGTTSCEQVAVGSIWGGGNDSQLSPARNSTWTTQWWLSCPHQCLQGACPCAGTNAGAVLAHRFGPLPALPAGISWCTHKAVTSPTTCPSSSVWLITTSCCQVRNAGLKLEVECGRLSGWVSYVCGGGAGASGAAGMLAQGPTPGLHGPWPGRRFHPPFPSPTPFTPHQDLTPLHPQT